MEKKTAIAIIVAAVACGILLALLSGFVCYRIGWKKGPETIRDTVTTIVVVRDTITQYRPEYITKTIVRKELVEVIDTVRVNDTTYVVLPVEQKVYADSNYCAVVSGINPSLDEISVYPETKYITKTITVYEPKKKFGFGIGVHGGYYLIYDVIDKKFATGPGAGGGISFTYNF